jgi:hypothetical protein
LSALQDIHQYVKYPYEIREAVLGKGGKGTFSMSAAKININNIQ